MVNSMFYNAKNCNIKIDNTDIDYLTFGKGDKYLVMIPGLGDGLKTTKGMAIPFAFLYKKFAKKYKVIVISRRNELPKNFTTENMADDVKYVLDSLNVTKIDLLGVSQGGMISQYIAIKYPDLVEKLILTVTSSRPNELIKESIDKWIDLAKKEEYKDIFIDTAEKSYREKTLKKYRKYFKYIDPFIKLKNPDRFIVQAESCISHNAYSKLNKIKCPTLVIGGRLDKIVGIDASIDIYYKIPNSKIHIYEKYGHGLYEEAKDFNDLIYKFFNK